MSAVRSRWMSLATSLQIPADTAQSAWLELESAYTEPHRHYHTLTHIGSVISALDRHRNRFYDARSAELALFFHDFVYDPARQDNEQASADRMLKMLEPTVPLEKLGRACRLITATRTHKATDDADTNLVLDIDMSILGAPWLEYLSYARGVYAEYRPHYGFDAYAAGRVALFIEPTLAKIKIFLTDAFAEKEEIARQNLAQERDLWRGGGLN